MAEQAVGNARKEFSLNMHLMAQEEIKAHAHRALQGVLQRHDAQFTLPAAHLLEHLGQIVAGMEDGRMSQIFHARKVGKGAFRAEIGHVLRPLQGTRGGEDFPPDGPQMFVRQRPRVLPGQIVQHLAFAQGLEDDARIAGLDPPHFQAEFRTLVEQGQQAAVHLLDAAADFPQPPQGGVGAFRTRYGHARPP